jgi:hypothetical protein
MEYIAEKFEDQNLMYRITTINNGKEITFNVVCANDESEIEGLVQFHLDFINNPKPIVPQEPVQPTKEQLLAELQTLSNKIQALEGAA